MRIAEKYGIEETKIKALIEDGHMSCSYSGTYDEVYYYYKAEVSKGIGTSQAVYNTSVKAKLSERQVYNIIHKLK
jgi:hypothetical protein